MTNMKQRVTKTVNQTLLFEDHPRRLRSGLVEIGRVKVAPDSMQGGAAAKELLARMPRNFRGYEFTVTPDGLLVHDADLFNALQCGDINKVRVKVLTTEQLDTLAKKSFDQLKGRLNYLERCEAVLRGQEAYETKFPLTRRGGYDRSAEDGGKKHTRKNCVYGESAYTEVAAIMANLRQRTLQQDVQIAKGLDRVIRDSIRNLTLARRKRELQLLAGYSPIEQGTLVSHMLEKGDNLENAISALGLAQLRSEEEETARDLKRLLKIAANNSGWKERSSSEVVSKVLEQFQDESPKIVAALGDLFEYYSLQIKDRGEGLAPKERIAA